MGALDEITKTASKGLDYMINDVIIGGFTNAVGYVTSLGWTNGGGNDASYSASDGVAPYNEHFQATSLGVGAVPAAASALVANLPGIENTTGTVAVAPNASEALASALNMSTHWNPGVAAQAQTWLTHDTVIAYQPVDISNGQHFQLSPGPVSVSAGLTQGAGINV